VGVNYYLGPDGSYLHRAKFTVDVVYLPDGLPNNQTGLGYLASDDEQFVLRGQFQLTPYGQGAGSAGSAPPAGASLVLPRGLVPLWQPGAASGQRPQRGHMSPRPGGPRRGRWPPCRPPGRLPVSAACTCAGSPMFNSFAQRRYLI